MKGVLFGCILLLFTHHLTFGQNVFSSPYSVYGIGLMNNRQSALNRSMGGVGIAVQDEMNLNNVNPASYWSIISPISHVYEIGLYLESDHYKTAKRTESNTTGGLNNLNYWFKFAPRWAATLGLSPFSSVSYNISAEKETGISLPATYRYEGSGNITQLYIGNSFQLFKNLSLGVNVAYLFGSINKYERIESGDLAETLTLHNKIFTRNFNFDFGIQYRVRFKNRSLIAGIVADDGLTLKGKEELTLTNEDADTLTSAAGGSMTYKLPKSIGVGLSLQSKRMILASDLKFKKWSEARFGNEDVAFQDTWTYGLGYTYKGNPDAETFAGLFSWRAGFYVENYHLLLKNNTLPSWGLSAGLALPVFDNKSSINLTYSFDRLGTTRDGLVLQHAQKIMLDIVIRDLWGVKRKFD